MGRNRQLYLTPRDVQIVLLVYRYDGLVSSQLQRRFWPGYGSRSPFYERLSRLIAEGYLRSVRLPSLKGQGSGPSFLTLGVRSYPLLKELVGLTSADIRRLPHSYVPMFWQHDAACRDVRL